MGGIVFGFFLMGNIGQWSGAIDADGLREVVPAFDGIWWLIVAVGFTVFASVFVQGAEGATFAIIPMVNPAMTGQIAGMAGAYGNVGAVIYLVLFSLVDSRTFFLILAGGALVAFLVTIFMLQEPKDAFAAEYIRDEEGRIE
jgi:NNP family nitrate/nitrite transporter-like MFS transporter